MTSMQAGSASQRKVEQQGLRVVYRRSKLVRDWK